MNRPLLDGIRSLHERLINQFSACPEAELRTQFHPDLSQLGWHLGHIAFIEQYWLREVVLGDNSRTADFHQHYFPELIEKSERGELPGITDFLQLQKDFFDTEKILSEFLSGQLKHPLLTNDYIGWFLLQHGQQHLEVMQLALQQKTLVTVTVADSVAKTFSSLAPAPPAVLFEEGEYEIGSNDVLACDNEQPQHAVRLSAFRLAERPVSNAEYLGFMQNAGYRNERFWNKAGWQWISAAEMHSPERWMEDAAGNWGVVDPKGMADIDPDAVVSGLSWYEADAFARYAGCRLPHEHEWEAAMKADSSLMNSTGEAWEWCANAFFPYEGFSAFPYERYSSPWFDKGHYTLKGCSPFSGETVGAPSFRNFYQPEKRHVFAGLRLASDA